MFSRIVLASLYAGILAGLLLTIIQQIQVVPLILEAETYENAALVSGSEAEEWAPDDGWQRVLYTTVANMGTSIGFALLLTAAFSLRQIISWKIGFLWGLACYCIFFVLPTLGLQPELPGTEAAALKSRQIWWLLTVTCSGVGLAFVALQKRVLLRISGVALLLLPHVIGAPSAPYEAGLLPEGLNEQFYWATLLVNAIFWLVLGSLSAGFFSRLSRLAT